MPPGRGQANPAGGGQRNHRNGGQRNQPPGGQPQNAPGAAGGGANQNRNGGGPRNANSQNGPRQGPNNGAGRGGPPQPRYPRLPIPQRLLNDFTTQDKCPLCMEDLGTFARDGRDVLQVVIPAPVGSNWYYSVHVNHCGHYLCSSCHDTLLCGESGGLHGLRDALLLERCMICRQGTGYYAPADDDQRDQVLAIVSAGGFANHVPSANANTNFAQQPSPPLQQVAAANNVLIAPHAASANPVSRLMNAAAAGAVPPAAVAAQAHRILANYARPISQIPCNGVLPLLTALRGAGTDGAGNQLSYHINGGYINLVDASTNAHAVLHAQSRMICKWFVEYVAALQALPGGDNLIAIDVGGRPDKIQTLLSGGTAVVGANIRHMCPLIMKEDFDREASIEEYVRVGSNGREPLACRCRIGDASVAEVGGCEVCNPEGKRRVFFLCHVYAFTPEQLAMLCRSGDVVMALHSFRGFKGEFTFKRGTMTDHEEATWERMGDTVEMDVADGEHYMHSSFNFLHSSRAMNCGVYGAFKWAKVFTVGDCSVGSCPMGATSMGTTVWHLSKCDPFDVLPRPLNDFNRVNATKSEELCGTKYTFTKDGKVIQIIAAGLLNDSHTVSWESFDMVARTFVGQNPDTALTYARSRSIVMPHIPADKANLVICAARAFMRPGLVVYGDTISADRVDAQRIGDQIRGVRPSIDLRPAYFGILAGLGLTRSPVGAMLGGSLGLTLAGEFKELSSEGLQSYLIRRNVSTTTALCYGAGAALLTQNIGYRLAAGWSLDLRAVLRNATPPPVVAVVQPIMSVDSVVPISNWPDQLKSAVQTSIAKFLDKFSTQAKVQDPLLLQARAMFAESIRRIDPDPPTLVEILRSIPARAYTLWDGLPDSSKYIIMAGLASSLALRILFRPSDPVRRGYNRTWTRLLTGQSDAVWRVPSMMAVGDFHDAARRTMYATMRYALGCTAPGYAQAIMIAITLLDRVESRYLNELLVRVTFEEVVKSAYQGMFCCLRSAFPWYPSINGHYVFAFAEVVEKAYTHRNSASMVKVIFLSLIGASMHCAISGMDFHERESIHTIWNLMCLVVPATGVLVAGRMEVGRKVHDIYYGMYDRLAHGNYLCGQAFLYDFPFVDSPIRDDGEIKEPCPLRQMESRPKGMIVVGPLLSPDLRPIPAPIAHTPANERRSILKRVLMNTPSLDTSYFHKTFKPLYQKVMQNVFADCRVVAMPRQEWLNTMPPRRRSMLDRAFQDLDADPWLAKYHNIGGRIYDPTTRNLFLKVEQTELDKDARAIQAGRDVALAAAGPWCMSLCKALRDCGNGERSYGGVRVIYGIGRDKTSSYRLFFNLAEQGTPIVMITGDDVLASTGHHIFSIDAKRWDAHTLSEMLGLGNLLWLKLGCPKRAFDNMEQGLNRNGKSVFGFRYKRKGGTASGDPDTIQKNCVTGTPIIIKAILDCLQSGTAFSTCLKDTALKVGVVYEFVDEDGVRVGDGDNYHRLEFCSCYPIKLSDGQYGACPKIGKVFFRFGLANPGHPPDVSLRSKALSLIAEARHSSVLTHYAATAYRCVGHGKAYLDERRFTEYATTWDVDPDLAEEDELLRIRYGFGRDEINDAITSVWSDYINGNVLFTNGVMATIINIDN